MKNYLAILKRLNISDIGRITTATLLIMATLSGFACYYFFVDTLMLSEITGKTNVPVADIFINLLDFDTGLTRYDIHNLAKKSGYWNMRIRQVESIQNPDKRKSEEEKLTAEMMQDPSIKKIVRKLFGFGSKAALGILKTIL